MGCKRHSSDMLAWIAEFLGDGGLGDGLANDEKLEVVSISVPRVFRDPSTESTAYPNPLRKNSFH